MKKITKNFALLTAVSFIASLASCGTDVPQAETSGDFSISEEIEDTTETTAPDSDEFFIAEATTDVTTTMAEDTTTSSDSGTSTASFIIVTRDPDSITTKKPAATAKKTTAVPSAPATTAQQQQPATTVSVSAIVTTVPTTTTSSSTGVSGITLSYYSAEISVNQTKKYPDVTEVIQEIWTSSDESVATVDQYGNITGVGEGSCIIRVVSATDSSLGAEVKVTVKKPVDLPVQVIDGITYVNNILIANKSYSLPSTYDPQGLTNETYNAFQELAAGAANDGLNIYISSGYRSYSYQQEIYNNYVYWYGQATADTFSARPGYSEHQTGLAIDVNIIDDSFIGTPEAIWLAEHCTEYGFIIRYPQGKQDITGYKYEPWHIRYVGKEVAGAIKSVAELQGDANLTLEEYLNIDSYYHD